MKFKLVLFILILFSCQNSEKIPQITRQVNLVHYFSGSLSGGVDSLVELFNKNNPNLTLSATAIEHEAFKTKILAALKSGTAPEIFSYWAGARTQAIISDLSPIDSVWNLEQMGKKFEPSIGISAATYNAKKYLVPLTQHYVGFFYNTKLLAKLGEVEPTDWSKFLELCERAKKAGIQPIALGANNRWPAQFYFDYLLLRTAGPEFHKELMEGRALWTDSKVYKVFELWKTLLDSGYIGPDSWNQDWDEDAGAQVIHGEALMTLMGTWLMGWLTGPSVEAKEGTDFGFFPFPKINQDVKSVALGPVDGLVVSSTASQASGVKEVLSFLSSAEAQKVFSKGSGGLAPNISVPEEFYTPLQRKVKGIIKSSESWVFNFDLSAPPEMAEAGLNLFIDFLKHPDTYPELLKTMVFD